MTTVLIHGVPDTARVWDRLLPLLPDEHVVALDLPGFGCGWPAGFEPTKERYLAWIIDSLEAIPGPLDVVAHDWGSILMLRVLTLRPDLIRSWAGGGAPFSADYAWHPTARLWQTPGAGEKAMDRLTPDIAVDMLRRAGLSETDARVTAANIDLRMKESILGLYRSGRDVFATWGPELAGIRDRVPGLVLWGETDPYAEPRFAERIGEATGARVACFEGCGHWWQVERPEETAAAIVSFRQAAGLS